MNTIKTTKNVDSSIQITNHVLQVTMNMKINPLFYFDLKTPSFRGSVKDYFTYVHYLKNLKIDKINKIVSLLKDKYIFSCQFEHLCYPSFCYLIRLPLPWLKKWKNQHQIFYLILFCHGPWTWSWFYSDDDIQFVHQLLSLPS